MREHSHLRFIDSEGIILVVRWITVAFGLLQTLSYYRPIPSDVQPWAYGSIGVFALASLALTIWWLRIRPRPTAGQRRERTRGVTSAQRRFGFASMTVDIAIALTLTWTYTFDANTAIFIVLFLPPLEAALRYGMRGAVITMLITSAGYTVRDIWGAAHYDIDVVPASISFRMGVGLLIAAMAGAMAERYERAHQQIVSALDQERAATDALRSLDDLRSTFLAAVSHELRTPLTSILGFALTIQQTATELETDTQEMLGYVVGEARQLERLLQDLLDVERIGRGGVTITRRPCDIIEVTHRLAARIEERLGRAIDVDGSDVVGIVDDLKIERIIDNLLSNAVKYSPRGTKICVHLTRTDDGVQIVVEDEGPGVPQRLRSSIFEPFERGLVTSAHQPGTGIGLSLVDQFARLHGGRAWVADRQDERAGSAFHVYLPDGPEGVRLETLSR